MRSDPKGAQLVDLMSESQFPKWFSSNSEYDLFLSSRVLSRGYGYTLHGPEGDDPEMEDVNLSTYRKKYSGSSLWSD